LVLADTPEQNKATYIDIMIRGKMSSKRFQRVIRANSEPAINEIIKFRVPFLNKSMMKRIKIALVDDKLENQRIERFRAYGMNKHKSTNGTELCHSKKSAFRNNTTRNCSPIVICRLRPEAESQAKPGQKKPGQARP
jgi:hypothetical protein